MKQLKAKYTQALEIRVHFHPPSSLRCEGADLSTESSLSY